MAPRKRYIARTDTPTHSLLFYKKDPNELTIEFTDKVNPQEGCNYYFSLSNKDWFDAAQLHHALFKFITNNNEKDNNPS